MPTAPSRAIVHIGAHKTGTTYLQRVFYALRPVLRDAGVVDLIRLAAEDEADAWAWFSRHKDQAYSFTDCTSFALMKRLRIPMAVSTDRHFRRAGFEVQPQNASPHAT